MIQEGFVYIAWVSREFTPLIILFIQFLSKDMIILQITVKL